MGVASHLYEVVQPSTDVSMQTVGEGLSSAVCILVCVGMSGDNTSETVPGGGSLLEGLGHGGRVPGLLCQVCLKSVEGNGFGRCYFWGNEQNMMVSTSLPYLKEYGISDEHTGSLSV